MKLTADILIVDKPNSSNRIYPRAAAEACIKRWEEANRSLPGVIGMDKGPIIGLADMSHIVEKLHLQGDTLVADIQVLATPAGAQLLELMKSGGVTFRSSGFGTLHEDGRITDYQLISINAVLDGTDL